MPDTIGGFDGLRRRVLSAGRWVRVAVANPLGDAVYLALGPPNRKVEVKLEQQPGMFKNEGLV